ncbi:hypothetical protein KIH86_17655 [Paenibacillus sp. HN-1]|uniref:hypothetical protein n=1 Tax=Paenibacillus TaxID=44249 RepID=UPI001CA7EA03|nr:MULTISPECIES: hypothetical protein [Paenibacillus]MBY9078305.1 hypothetical protein [Paenibacillus sp. CGMCC 1.18879]MBY9086036.1 hypothetical protein [Paenibacillus sinensis]
MKEETKITAEKQSTEQTSNVKSQPVVQEGSFTREQFLASAKYSYQDKDVLAALLEPEKRYTTTEAQRLIEDFKNKEAE